MDTSTKISQAPSVPNGNDDCKTARVLIDRVLGHVDRLEHRPPAIDWVDLTWMQCMRRALRVRTRSGCDLKIVLRLGQKLRHGDIVWQSADLKQMIAVNVLPTEVIIGRTTDARKLALLAFELGNLHVPIELEKDELIAPADGPVMEAFDKLEFDCQKCSRRFTPTAMGSPLDLSGVSLSPGFRIERR